MPIVVLVLFIFASLAIAWMWVITLRPAFEKSGLLRPLPQDSMRARMISWTRNSATVLLGKITLWSGSLMEIALQIGDVMQVPGLREQLEAIGLGRAFSVAMIILGVLTLIARTRKKSEDPV